MGFLFEPWFLVVFAIAVFFVFLALGARGNYRASAGMMRVTRWLIVGISLVIVTFGVLKVLQDHHSSTFQPRTAVAPVTVH